MDQPSSPFSQKSKIAYGVTAALFATSREAKDSEKVQGGGEYNIIKSFRIRAPIAAALPFFLDIGGAHTFFGLLFIERGVSDRVWGIGEAPQKWINSGVGKNGGFITEGQGAKEWMNGGWEAPT